MTNSSLILTITSASVVHVCEFYANNSPSGDLQILHKWQHVLTDNPKFKQFTSLKTKWIGLATWDTCLFCPLNCTRHLQQNYFQGSVNVHSWTCNSTKTLNTWGLLTNSTTIKIKLFLLKTTNLETNLNSRQLVSMKKVLTWSELEKINKFWTLWYL